jgi:hypothetical protein
MASPKKKSKAKTVLKFKDLRSRKSPKAGSGWFLKVDGINRLNPQPLPP